MVNEHPPANLATTSRGHLDFNPEQKEKHMNEHLIRLSKTISHALRHAPGDYGLALDAEGWVEIDALLAALRRRLGNRRQIGLAEIETIMAESEKQRFEIRAGKIRAFYGHSTPTKIEKESVAPHRSE